MPQLRMIFKSAQGHVANVPIDNVSLFGEDDVTHVAIKGLEGGGPDFVIASPVEDVNAQLMQALQENKAVLDLSEQAMSMKELSERYARTASPKQADDGYRTWNFR